MAFGQEQCDEGAWLPVFVCCVQAFLLVDEDRSGTISPPQLRALLEVGARSSGDVVAARGLNSLIVFVIRHEESQSYGCARCSRGDRAVARSLRGSPLS